MAVLTYLERGGEAVDDVSLQALAFVSMLTDAAPLEAVIACVDSSQALSGAAGAHGVRTLHVFQDDLVSVSAPLAVARAVVAAREDIGATVIVGPGTESGNEILAHVAAILDVPFAANCIVGTLGAEGVDVTRVRWGGSLLEEARIHGSPVVLSVQPHAVAVQAPGDGIATVAPLAVELSDADRALRVSGRVEAGGGGLSLTDAKVVVTGGRGVGSAEGFAPVEELAALLGGAVGCSRAVTISGWRPHTDQVGQTGTKVAPDLYIACGVSGATQHMAGCKGAKKILAVNTDREASILASADYAVIGDLHEVLPAISAELRRVRGA